MKNQDLNTRRSLATPRGVGVMCDFYAVRAENATLWDANGKEYIDFAGGIAVLNTGHLHPKVKAAVSAQLDNFTHTAYQIVPYEGYVSLAERINRLAPIDGLKKSAFFTTGVEAVENAIKIARSATGRSGVIAFSGSFHGRTMLGMALTGKVAPYKLSFGPMPGDIYHVPFPNGTQSITVADSLKALDLLFKVDIDPKRVAAIIIEPVQGDGGFLTAPPEFLQALRALADKHGIVLILDEIQTGFGRTGTWFGFQHAGIQPDLVTVAKSLAGGLPLSGVVGKAHIMDAPLPGGLGGTYGGNALACAAALAVIDAFEQEQLLARSQVLGERLRQGLLGLQARCSRIGDVRGTGFMLAMELIKDDPARTPDADLNQRLIDAARAGGLLVIKCGVHRNVLRFLAPLVTSEAQVDEALEILDGALARVLN